MVRPSEVEARGSDRRTGRARKKGRGGEGEGSAVRISPFPPDRRRLKNKMGADPNRNGSRGWERPGLGRADADADVPRDGASKEEEAYRSGLPSNRNGGTDVPTPPPGIAASVSGGVTTSYRWDGTAAARFLGVRSSMLRALFGDGGGGNNEGDGVDRSYARSRSVPAAPSGLATSRDNGPERSRSAGPASPPPTPKDDGRAPSPASPAETDAGIVEGAGCLRHLTGKCIRGSPDKGRSGKGGGRGGRRGGYETPTRPTGPGAPDVSLLSDPSRSPEADDGRRTPAGRILESILPEPIDPTSLGVRFLLLDCPLPLAGTAGGGTSPPAGALRRVQPRVPSAGETVRIVPRHWLSTWVMTSRHSILGLDVEGWFATVLPAGDGTREAAGGDDDGGVRASAVDCYLGNRDILGGEGEGGSFVGDGDGGNTDGGGGVDGSDGRPDGDGDGGAPGARAYRMSDHAVRTVAALSIVCDQYGLASDEGEWLEWLAECGRRWEIWDAARLLEDAAPSPPYPHHTFERPDPPAGGAGGLFFRFGTDGEKSRNNQLYRE